jgi:hypothetical protein
MDRIADSRLPLHHRENAKTNGKGLRARAASLAYRLIARLISHSSAIWEPDASSKPA